MAGVHPQDDLLKMTHRENWKVQHERLHVKHRGHEAMHAEMVMILIATLVVAQIVRCGWFLFTSPSNSTGGGSCPCGACSPWSPATSSSEPRASRCPAARPGWSTSGSC
ncbi:hypothetical protein FQN60_017432 [Etheostoma spectabile]|uniref:Uncharacterized protein n=1 Tax=Etheostoma spectabile TaxID=54343 RepID=A0A5J5DFF2_9PERO|nr:hypothetical protein FQN60_017432 [Etheostoma spectabile]